jgi:hypothetical protein
MGIAHGTRSLPRIVMIAMVESAAVYLATVITFTVLTTLRSNAQFILMYIVSRANLFLA